MPGYMGGKFRIRYQIAEYINSLSPRVYMEPFCGFCWVGERVRCPVRHFSDINADVILMWQELQRGWKPPTQMTAEEFGALKRQPGPSALRGFAGTCCAYGGELLRGGFARDKQGVNYAAQGARQLGRRILGLRGATFACMDYRAALDSTDADVVYLDPPYAGTRDYGQFDSVQFWTEVRRRSGGRRRILVSEYEAPEDFTVVLATRSRMGLRVGSRNALEHELREEKLFEFNPPDNNRVVFSSFDAG